jgi:hypothetical protein
VAECLLVVESRPASAEQEQEFHAWYEDVHFPEMLALEWVRSARRWPDRESGSWFAIYEVDADVETARQGLKDALPTMQRPVGVQLSPPPVIRWLG